MSDWSEGYVADIGYTFGYYSELNPLRIKLAFASQGIVFPEIGAACELGFGQGLSTNIHASASVVQWSGTDFNPEQAGFAQELSKISDSTAQLFDQSFAQYCTREDLPDFDFISLHGIWSWISDENRNIIVDFLRRKLKVGGVLYISYNTMPGWSNFAPVRHLMTEHANAYGAKGKGIVNQIDGALEFTQGLLATKPSFAKVNKTIDDRLAKLKEQNRRYLAHEYFNQDWEPMYFSKMARWLESAKLSFVCSAHYQDHLDAINLTSVQQEFLKEILDPVFKQTTRDFIVNQQFRKDYWVKGFRKMSPLERIDNLRAQIFLLMEPREDVSLKIMGVSGEAQLSEKVYSPILDIMKDHKPYSIAQLEKELKSKEVNFAQLTQAILLLCGKGTLSPAQDVTSASKAKKHTDKLNQHIMNKARSTAEISYLASPVVGGGVVVGRFQQLFLLALKQGKTKPEEWAAAVDQTLRAQGQKIIKEGKTLESKEEQLAELTAQATEFAQKRLPILKTLQIA